MLAMVIRVITSGLTPSWCNGIIVVTFVLTWVVIPISGASAATYTWSPGSNGGDGVTWNTTAANWNNAAATWDTTADQARFQTVGGTATVSGTVSASDILANETFTLSGDSTARIVLDSGSVGTSPILSAASGKTLTIAAHTEVLNSAGSHRRVQNVELQAGGKIDFNTSGGVYGYVNNLLISGGTMTNFATTSTDFYVEGGGLTITNGTLDARNRRRFYLQGDVTIDGSTASLRSDAGTFSGVSSTPFAFNANGVQLNLREGELQAAVMTVVSGTGTGFNLGHADRTTAATLRPYAGRNLSLNASLNIILQGDNAVLSSTDGAGGARTVTVNAALGESGGRRNIQFAGLGTTNLAAANTLSGTTLLTGGTLALANRDALQNSTLDVGSSVTFTVAGNGTYALGGLAGSTGLSIGGNTLRIGSNHDSTTYGGIISGTGGSLEKVGTGSLLLSAVQTLTGATTILGGRLEIGAAGGLNTSSGITINGGELRYNAATALTKPLTFTAGTISGTGTVGTPVIVATGNVISPGNSPGTQSYTSLHAWAPGGTYQWELNALTGSAGTTWDLVNVTSGTFDLSALAATPGNQFVLDLITLDALNAAGPLANPYDGGSYMFAIASYDPANFLLPSGFLNAAGTDLTSLFGFNNLANWQGPKPELGNISVRINSEANGIYLVIVPEPESLVLAAAGAAAALAYGRRRRSCISLGT